MQENKNFNPKRLGMSSSTHTLIPKDISFKWKNQYAELLRRKDKEISNLKSVVSYMNKTLKSREKLIRTYMEEIQKLKVSLKQSDTLLTRYKGESSLWKRKNKYQPQINRSDSNIISSSRIFRPRMFSPDSSRRRKRKKISIKQEVTLNNFFKKSKNVEHYAQSKSKSRMNNYKTQASTDDTSIRRKSGIIKFSSSKLKSSDRKNRKSNKLHTLQALDKFSTKLRSRLGSVFSIGSETSSVNLVTNNQGIKNTNHSISSQIGTKSLLQMSKVEMEKFMNGPKMREVEHIVSDSEQFLERLGSLTELNQMRISDFLSSLICDFRNVVDLFFKTKSIVGACVRISANLEIDDAFSIIIGEVCKGLKCDRASVFLLDDANKELWTRIAKGQNSIIRIPHNKGIAGYVCTTGQYLKIDEAYADQRFNQKVDQITNYRTKTILCFPIHDPTNDKIIGVCQAINKLKGYFNSNDIGILKILSKQAGAILKSSMTYNQNLTNLTKIKRVIKIGVDCFNSKSTKELQKLGESYIKDMINVETTRIWFVDYNNKKMYRYQGKHKILHQIDSNLGLLGKVCEDKDMFICRYPSRSKEYNQNVDINSELPLVTCPILDKEQKTTIGIIQVVHLSSFFRADALNRDYFEQEMLDLFCQLMTSCIEHFVDLKVLYKTWADVRGEWTD